MVQDSADSKDGIIDNSTPVFDQALPHFTQQAIFHTPELVEFLANLLDQNSSSPRTVYIMGCAGGGKSYLARKLIKHYINKISARTFYMSTDDYCIGTRQNRRDIIKKTHDALQEKDFSLMEKHIQEIKALGKGQEFTLPQEYDPETGLALAGNGTRTVQGPLDVLVVDGNFYVPAEEDLLVYLHVSDPVRYELRAIRDTQKGQRRARDRKEVRAQFITRQETQDIPHTLPYLKRAMVLIESKPQIKNGEIQAAEYVVWRNKSFSLPSSENASREESSGLFL